MRIAIQLNSDQGFENAFRFAILFFEISNLIFASRQFLLPRLQRYPIAQVHTVLDVLVDVALPLPPPRGKKVLVTLSLNTFVKPKALSSETCGVEKITPPLFMPNRKTSQR